MNSGHHQHDPNFTKEKKFYEYITNLPSETISKVKNKPLEVLKLIDNYPDWFMNIGPKKGEIITKEIRSKKPKILIELGGYIGYSAVLLANEIIDDLDAKFYSFELNPEFAKISTEVIKLAGLSRKVEIIVGKASYNLPLFKERLQSEKGQFVPLDFILLDHWKNLYLPDLKLMEQINLIAPGTLICADNVIKPGAPEYLKYLRYSPEEKKDYNLNYKDPDYPDLIGRWNLIYDTETIEVVNDKGFKDGVEITKCTDYLSG
ncbi:unnamed protein product [Candida verbasci]|uniref:catechol O-methyltransferase n=1 Tax=Candida verbasci TaxID=1227364 RepID=A0A9W4U046_9ASCO|nr:unnamed protein product [Candida verbasci]